MTHVCVIGDSTTDKLVEAIKAVTARPPNIIRTGSDSDVPGAGSIVTLARKQRDDTLYAAIQQTLRATGCSAWGSKRNKSTPGAFGRSNVKRGLCGES